jgi:CheY-like chemotaxis protein
MMTHAEPTSDAHHPLPTVGVVARRAPAGVLDAVLDAGSYDIVFVGSMEHAYTQIKRTTPQLVIVYLEIDDEQGFQLLSMLKLDPGTSNIPVLTYLVPPQIDTTEPEDVAFDLFESPQAVPMSLN